MSHGKALLWFSFCLVVNSFIGLYALTMEDAQAEMPKPSTDLAEQSKNSNGKFLNLALGFLAVVVVAVGVYFWQHQNVDNLSKKNASLSSQLAIAQKANKTPQSSAGATSSTVSYKASLGKFTLTLPDKYIFIVGNDSGGSNSGTSLTIGDKTSDDSVVDSPTGATVAIEAYGLHGRSFSSLVSGYINDRAPFGKTTIQIDGVAAESYMFGGESAPRGIYFTKGDMFYRIELGDTGGSIDQKLGAIIAGFKFD